MPRRLTDESKIAQGRGTGVGAHYKPYIRAAEFNSRGTTEVIPDWKHGRMIQCLSQGEAMWYYILRWDDDNVDIREQFPLLDRDRSKALTQWLAKELGFRGTGCVMTTDFLVTRPGNGLHAYAVKASPDLSRREREKLQIEEAYWEMQDIPFDILYKTDIDVTLATNIRLVTRYYDEEKVFDRYSAIKHMIATKQYDADLSVAILDTAVMDRIYHENHKEVVI